MEVSEAMTKKYVVELTLQEREELQRLTRSSKVSSKTGLHAHILLKADEGENSEGWKDAEIAEVYGIRELTVQRIRQRFVEEGLESALNRKPTSRIYRRKIEGEEEARLITLACSDPPQGRSRWTLQLLADKLVELKIVESVSDETVRRTLKKTNSSPG